MTFRQAIASGFANYVNFYGRATVPEFWLWVLFAGLVAVATEIVDAAIFIPHPGLSPLNTLCTLVLLPPSLAVMARRLHDVGRSGWWLLLVPTGVGILVLLYWATLNGTPGANRYDRLASAAAE